MPRPKGSKNKAKKAAAGTDFQALIAEKQAEKETANCNNKLSIQLVRGLLF